LPYAPAGSRPCRSRPPLRRSRLYRDELLETFAVHRPHKITVSMYGAGPETADALTQTRGAFKNAYRGMTAAAEVGLPVEVTLIITKHNVDELDETRAMVRDLGLPFKEYASISPTYTGKGTTLATQVPGLIGKSDIFQGCPAGHTSFHVDPLGFATMCKVGRGKGTAEPLLPARHEGGP